MQPASMNATVNQGFSVAPNMTNNATLTPPGGSPVPRDIQIGVTVLAVTVIILAMIGNTLVIYIVCTVNHMRSSTNTLIANLAVADLLMTIDIPYILKWVYVRDQWFGTVMGSVLCKFFHSAQVGSLAASVFSLVAISLDRSFGVLFPLKKIMTPKVVRFAIAMTWLGALALTVPLMVAVENTEVKGPHGTGYFSCKENWTSVSAPTFTTFLFTTAYIIPMSIIAIVYCLAGLRLCSRKLPGHGSFDITGHRRAKTSGRRASLMLVTVVVIFALSWFPLQAFEMIQILEPQLLKENTIPMEVFFVIPWLGYCNSAINPILYAIFSENYRREFYRVLCRGPSQKDRYRNTIINSLRATQTTRLSQGTTIAADIPMHILRREANREELGTFRGLNVS